MSVEPTEFSDKKPSGQIIVAALIAAAACLAVPVIGYMATHKSKPKVFDRAVPEGVTNILISDDWHHIEHGPGFCIIYGTKWKMEMRRGE